MPWNYKTSAFRKRTVSYREQISLRDQGKLTPVQAEIFRVPRPAEMLFDVEKDPNQLTDLTADPQHRATLEHLRRIMEQWQKETGDTVPKVLTEHWQDPKTGRQNYPGYVPSKRGDIPGKERTAQQINKPGPR